MNRVNRRSWRGRNGGMIQIDGALCYGKECAQLIIHEFGLWFLEIFLSNIQAVGDGSLGCERPAIELLVEPAEHSSLCRAQRLDPTVHEKLFAATLRGNLLRFS